MARLLEKLFRGNSKDDLVADVMDTKDAMDNDEEGSLSRSSAAKRLKGEVHPSDMRKKYDFHKEELTLDVRYEPYKKLGSGSYGFVFTAKDEKDGGNKVAIKKVKEVYHNLIDAKRILREVKLMQHFHHDNIVQIKDIINPLTRKDFEDLYFVMEHVDSDLNKIIRSNNKLSNDHIAYVIYQILCGLKYMHSAHVLHRDLKPSNVLIDGNCHVKICDFGLAKGIDEAKNVNTEYVQTRWYRAPEIILSGEGYSYAIDVWSVGCILAELYTREPLFPGDDYIDQVRQITKILGTPEPDELTNILRVGAADFLGNLERRNPVPWNKILPAQASPEAIDLLSKLLTFDPAHRITVDEALKHPFLAEFYDEKFVTETSVCKEIFSMTWENQTRTKEDIQQLMFQEVLNFRPHAAANNPFSPRKSLSAGSKHRRGST